MYVKFENGYKQIEFRKKFLSCIKEFTFCMIFLFGQLKINQKCYLFAYEANWCVCLWLLGRSLGIYLFFSSDFHLFHNHTI
jgi:hypothetical protein